jgi:hypothetical protein
MRTFLLLIASICCIPVFAQIYLTGKITGKDSCDFMSACSIIQLDSSEETVWTIGKPNKVILSGGKDDSMALFTDTSLYYKENVFSSFEIFAPSDSNSTYGYFDGNAMLSFWHKLNSDTLKDGGFIEISNDNGTTWKNVLYDSSNIEVTHKPKLGNNMYNRDQKLYNNEPGFSGTISTWTLCEIPLIRFIPMFTKSQTRIRFTFVSDSVPSQKEGWIIDNIKLSDVSLPGGLNLLNKPAHGVCVYPNPFTNVIEITSVEGNLDGTLSILTMEGKMLKTFSLMEEKSVNVDVSDLSEGIYTLLYHNAITGNQYSKLMK